MITLSGRALARLAAAAVVLGLARTPAQAVPSFAAQTGQPCTACHVGGFGPQLTPFGRAFKIGGYTATGGAGSAAQIPLAAMVLGSFTQTATAQPTPPAAHFGRNDNAALDQISVFLAGRVTDDLGGFVQGTFSGIDHSTTLDNTDVRATLPFELGQSEVRLGISVNSGPTVQDPYNSTPVWFFPFAASALAPTPATQPLLESGLIGNSIGVTAYGWYDHSLYVEAGAYASRSPSLLQATGTTLGPGATAEPAPYARVAYEWDWDGQAVHVGALLLAASLSPAVSGRRSDGGFGHDRYTDTAVDAGYQFLGSGRNILTADLLALHEDRSLHGSVAMATAGHAAARLDEARVSLIYFYENTYGLLLGWRNLRGIADPVLFAPAPVGGSRSGSPNSNTFIIEADWIPFGKEGSPAAPFANLRLAVQDTVYTRFNGAARNYDGFGRSAGANDTLYAYAWLAF
jgi:hypothetical protein